MIQPAVRARTAARHLGDAAVERQADAPAGDGAGLGNCALEGLELARRLLGAEAAAAVLRKPAHQPAQVPTQHCAMPSGRPRSRERRGWARTCGLEVLSSQGRGIGPEPSDHTARPAVMHRVRPQKSAEAVVMFQCFARVADHEAPNLRSRTAQWVARYSTINPTGSVECGAGSSCRYCAHSVHRP